MRLALVLLLIHALVPPLGEAAAVAVLAAVAGHEVHAGEAGGDPCDEGTERGCGAAEHHCACCLSQAFDAPRVEVAMVTGVEPRPPVSGARLRSLHAPPPPYRPPIHS